MTVASRTDQQLRFPCFGTTVTVRVADGPDSAALLEEARRLLLDVHARLSRFLPDSELSRLNRDPRMRVPASPLLCRFADAVAAANRWSGGLVDATCLPAVEAAGYRSSLDPAAPRTDREATTSPPGPRGLACLVVADANGRVHRPAGVRLDSGGLGKGLAADLVAEHLADGPAWAVECGGDLRVGGSDGRAWPVDVTDPHVPGRVVHRLRVRDGAVATSGTTRRSWTTTDGGRAHHLIDPRTGAPAVTDLVQVTAQAPTGLEAEVRAKTALLRGRDRAAGALPDGGVLVTRTGAVHVVLPREAA